MFYFLHYYTIKSEHLIINKSAVYLLEKIKTYFSVQNDVYKWLSFSNQQSKPQRFSLQCYKT